MYDIGIKFMEDDFDLRKFKVVTVARKRELFWQKSSGLFNLISTVSLLLIFAVAWFLYIFMTYFIQHFTRLR